MNPSVRSSSGFSARPLAQTPAFRMFSRSHWLSSSLVERLGNKPMDSSAESGVLPTASSNRVIGGDVGAEVFLSHLLSSPRRRPRPDLPKPWNVLPSELEPMPVFLLFARRDREDSRRAARGSRPNHNLALLRPHEDFPR